MSKLKFVLGIGMAIVSSLALGGAYSHHASGKITSLLAHGTDPAIRLSGNISPTQCDGGTYGWLYFQGTPEEKHRIYASALTFAVTGHVVTVYTNSDGARCRINNIQLTSGLN